MNKRNTQKVLRVIEGALETLRNKKNWIQNSVAENCHGEYAVPGEPTAQRFCATGALRHFALVQASASDPHGVIESIQRAAESEVYRALNQVSHRDVGGVIEVNDSSRNAHARILRGLRVARNNLRARLAA